MRRNKLGEYNQPDILHVPPGSPPGESVYFAGERKAALPPEFSWIREFYNEISDDFLKRIAKRVIKTMMPSYLYPPFYHTPIDMMNSVQVAAAGGTGTVLTFTVPQNEMARIRFYGQDITPVVPPLPGTEWAEVVWSFNVNNSPLEFYNRFLGQRGAPVWPAETTIVLDGADTFTITVINNSPVNAYNIWAAIRGWRWSKLITQLPDEDMLEQD